MRNLIRLCGDQARMVHDDPWLLLGEGTNEPTAPLILPLAEWQAQQAPEVLAGERSSPHGVLLQPDDDPETLRPWLNVLPLIAIGFPSFSDGRGYSQAYLLRARLGWRGELRAVGDVLREIGRAHV